MTSCCRRSWAPSSASSPRGCATATVSSGSGGWAPAGRGGIGVTALFAGDSGTGKTMSAEVVAGDLGFDLYVIDLVDRRRQVHRRDREEPRPDLRRGRRVNGVLLFDEADALFGKRSEVKDAHDRYANVEVAYLLQRMERFDGLAILTTNLRANSTTPSSAASTPSSTSRCPTRPPTPPVGAAPAAGPAAADDLDLDFLAARFKLTGGNIRNIASPRLPRRRRGPPGRWRPRPGHRARVPQAGPPDGGGRVRLLSGARDPLMRGERQRLRPRPRACPFGQTSGRAHAR